MLPLVEGLRRHFDVWYDDYKIVPGQSLRGSIDRGLSSCDFGIVVLSPKFFEKNWTETELDALFALESKNRKVIIPIWLDVGVEELRRFSVILSTRAAIQAGQPIPAIVDRIIFATSLAQRTHEVLEPDPATKALTDAMAALSSRELDDSVLPTPAGAKLYQSTLDRICHQVWARLSAFNNEIHPRFERVQHPDFIVSGPTKLWLKVASENYSLNSARRTRITVAIYLPGFAGSERLKSEDVETHAFGITCIGSDALGFTTAPSEPVRRESDIISFIVERYSRCLEWRIQTHTAP